MGLAMIPLQSTEKSDVKLCAVFVISTLLLFPFKQGNAVEKLPFKNCFAHVLQRIDFRPTQANVFYTDGLLTIKDFAKILNDPEPVFLGFRKDGHYFVTVGEKSLDGDVLRIPKFRKKVKFATGDTLFYFPNISSEIKAEWLKEMSGRRPPKFTCVRAACFGLKKLGIHVQPGTNQIVRGQMYRNAVEKGFLDSSGDYIDYSILLTAPDLLNHQQNLRWLKSRDRRSMRKVYVGGGIVAFIGGALGYFGFQENQAGITTPLQNSNLNESEQDTSSIRDSVRIFE